LALAQGLSGLVKGLHLTGIAEGIETQTQAEILRAQGWQCGQGYYFGRPGPMPVTSRFTGVNIDVDGDDFLGIVSTSQRT
jgi:EAL domain-containing protein (putative c-di-GMP-specific phosphodiesterase class I)